MRTTWNFFTAGQLVFGRGAIRQLGNLVARRALSRLFVVTDSTLVDVGIANRLTATLSDADIQFQVFDGGEAEPSIAAATCGIDQARAFAPDAIVGLGGGSNMDLAKYVAAAVTHGGSPYDYFGVENLPGPVMPLICVPTTSGTGSEVSHAAVLTDTENQMKVSMLSNHLRPDLAIVDPELTTSCPKTVTADSGIDALTHAIEAYTAVDYDKMNVPSGESAAYEGRFPLGDCLAERAIQLVGQHLRRAVSEPDNLDAREGMSLAATLAGMSFSNCGVALVHALEYPLGGALHCSHGAGNGLLLPFVMRFNLPERTQTFARIAELLGEETGGLDESSAAERAVAAVEQLRRDIGIPQNIREIGGREDQLPTFAEKAFELRRLQWVNPRKSTLQDFEDILRAAF